MVATPLVAAVDLAGGSTSARPAIEAHLERLAPRIDQDFVGEGNRLNQAFRLVGGQRLRLDTDASALFANVSTMTTFSAERDYVAACGFGGGTTRRSGVSRGHTDWREAALLS